MNTMRLLERDLSTNVNKMREQGIIPGVLYGPDVHHQLVAMPSKELMKIMNQAGEVYEVQSNGQSCYVKFDEIQRNPVRNSITHFSLVQLPQGMENDVEVPVVIEGEGPGVKKGGVLVTLKSHVTVTSSPSQMPQVVTVNVDHLNLGEFVTIADVQRNLGLAVVGEPDDVVVMCQAVTLKEDLDHEDKEVNVELDPEKVIH